MSLMPVLDAQIVLQGADDELELRHCSQEDKNAPILPIDLTSCTFAIQLRESLDSAVVLDELTTANGRILITNAADGWYSLLWPAAVTSPMAWASAVGQLEMHDSLGKIHRLWQAKFKLSREGTR